jgi:hypothetical protein
MDQRRQPRFAVQLPLSYSGTKEAGGGLVSCLSAGGCTVLCDEAVSPGTFLVLHIHLPEGYAALKVDLAEIRWTTVGRLGVEFIRFRAEDKTRLSCLIAALERGRGGFKQAS